MKAEWIRDKLTGSYKSQVGPIDLLVFRGGNDAIVRLPGWTMRISHCGGVKHAKLGAEMRLRDEIRPLYEALKGLYGDE